MVWKFSAPSNIALIKYMGKKDFSLNIPSNASLSYTLDNLRTFVELEKIDGEDHWQPLQQEGCLVPSFSEKGQKRFVDFFKKLKSYYGVKENFLIRSANNFPSDSGMASSASSFAALTMVADEAFKSLGYKNKSGLHTYQMAREGSGSSCRSFFSPWAVWKDTEVFSPKISLNLHHKIILIDSSKKEVSSGEAHKRIETSLLNRGRKERAEDRLQSLVEALQQDQWQKAYDLVWSEFWDMHTLFETSSPSFRYMTFNSVKALQLLDQKWKELGDGPLITMDAGANIHLLFRDTKCASAYEKICKEAGLECI